MVDFITADAQITNNMCESSSSGGGGAGGGNNINDSSGGGGGGGNVVVFSDTFNSNINEMLSSSQNNNNYNRNNNLLTNSSENNLISNNSSGNNNNNNNSNSNMVNEMNNDDDDSTTVDTLENEIEEEPLEFILKFRYPESTDRKVVITRLKKSLCFNNTYPYYLRSFITKDRFIDSIKKINSKSHRPFYFVFVVHCILLLFCLGLLLVGLLPRINKVSIVIFTALIVVSFFYFVYDLLIMNSRYLQNIELELENLNVPFQQDQIEWKLIRRSYIDFHRKKITKLWIEIHLPEDGPLKPIETCLSFSDITISFDPNEIPIIEQNYYYSNNNDNLKIY